MAPVTASSNLKENTMLQDDELEETSQMIIRDLFRAQNITQSPTIYFLVSNKINAGATARSTIIIYTAFVLACDNVHEFIGVMAHETAHIQGGHFALSQHHFQNASIPGILAIALSGIAAIASGSGEVFAAGTMGGMSMMERGMLKFSRTQEDSADAGALNILKRFGWSAKGLKTFLEKLDQKFSSFTDDPYLLTHPITAERISKLNAHLAQETHADKTPPMYAERFERMRGKIFGFTQEPHKTLIHYTNQNSTEAHYARAIAYFRMRNHKAFEKEMDMLLKNNPNDTYFLELKGQALFEMGKHGQALSYFTQARKNRTKNSFGLDIMTSQAIIQSKGDYQEVIKLLHPHLARDPEQPFAWRLLGNAYSALGQSADASGCLAEAFYWSGEHDAAKIHA
ncbi:MAG: M48 family metalloprotease, partial [Alphaproteobacteria bacterium]|nr:M48 family metalloprotease [Alphaproteobacteria bacterium]